ncbi:class I SAM-dependent methyltransferase [Nocardioides sp. GY 10113]|uniref:class I SAM-dependent methyltransferase n=1 Tax=Nocardioides sp. GY 10113 TaxID=2569761 RepID=UPI0010A83778|nr:class I SAM-dependent methyltransferase [Nocardioides sp. GY 10113]TIC87412.1 class I SAM-dependent methyltransferase [Nocardioides sp. GY 10113]
MASQAYGGVLPAVPNRLARRLGARVTVRGVDEAGIALTVRGPDRALDVLFDGRRIWSFWAVRDTTPAGGLRRFVAWPERMRRFLDGAARVSVVDHVADECLHDRELTFGAGEGRVAFVSSKGVEVSLDKSGRFSPTFSGRSEDQRAPLLDAMEQVVAVLAEADVVAFPAWGTLLGAVREQDLIGHDSDADLGYLSRGSTPVDVARESFALQRLLNRRGFETYRYSGAAFRIQVVESDGSRRGLDLFAGFFDQGRFYLMGEVGTDFREEWLVPYTTCRIAGREFPAPARPEKVLEASYGPGWRTPDPAFQFSTPPDVAARLDAWFRGTAPYRGDWERELAGRPPGARRPSSLARWLHRNEPPGTRVLEVGIGDGRDLAWLAAQGRSVVGYDYVARAGRAAQRRAERRGHDLTLRPLNLTELRSVLGAGARVSREPGPTAMLARHVLDATSASGRANLCRFASMALRGGGRLYAEFRTGPGDGAGQGGPGQHPVPAAEVEALVTEAGGTVLSVEEVLPIGDDTEAEPAGERRGVVRVIAEWT